MKQRNNDFLIVSGKETLSRALLGPDKDVHLIPSNEFNLYAGVSLSLAVTNYHAIKEKNSIAANCDLVYYPPRELTPASAPISLSIFQHPDS